MDQLEGMIVGDNSLRRGEKLKWCYSWKPDRPYTLGVIEGSLTIDLDLEFCG